MDPNGRRILMVMDSLAVGGTETHVLSVVKALRSLGVRPLYAGAGGPLYEAYARAGVPMYDVDLTPGTLADPADAPRTVQRLKRVIQGGQADLVHVHQMPSGLYAARAAAELGVPVAFSVHGTYYSSGQLEEMRRLGASFVSVSRPVERFLRELGIPSFLVPNGVDSDEFYPAPAPERLRRKWKIPPDAVVIVYVSRLAWDKAAVCSMLLRAAAGIRRRTGRNLHVVAVGGGPQYREIERLADSLQSPVGESFLHLTGGQTKVRDFYAMADLVVGTGRVALEAMFCAKPVLAIGNHGYFGLVEPSSYAQAWDRYFGDHDSLSKTDVNLIASDLEAALADRLRLRRIGDQAFEWVRGTFDIHRIGLMLAGVYENAIRGAAERKGGRS
ncbi:glycosyltransferase [Cohnella zeiphila]|uniref:Glycosyltransferase n=1 Tax=Cohnella zeiphila TaxID=2761120 RepID=A0A7X0SKP1_9BACL|nr:glycosyltransferase [Cohnella zeiphila]MBB6731773.1 glycosyltransferase [Cohnella zeiphila]